jgi:hypothetical protein
MCGEPTPRPARTTATFHPTLTCRQLCHTASLTSTYANGNQFTTSISENLLVYKCHFRFNLKSNHFHHLVNTVMAKPHTLHCNFRQTAAARMGADCANYSGKDGC